MEATTTIAAINQEVSPREWAAQIEAQRASGLSVREFCEVNGVNIKTYCQRILLRA